MITITRVAAKNGVAAHFVGYVVLHDGRTVGTGYGPTRASAGRFACLDCLLSDDEAVRTAGKGNLRWSGYAVDSDVSFLGEEFTSCGRYNA